MTAALSPLRTDTDPPAMMRPPFHGWRIVAFASIAVAMTAPGQTTGVSPFIDPVMAELGLSRSAVSTAYLVGTLLLGYLIDRYDHPRLLIAASMVLLGIGLAWATVLTPGWSALGYGAVIGASANGIRAVEAALTPRMFGTGHLASIRSILAAVGVAATAVGPLLFAAAHDATGSYTAILLASIVLPSGVIVAAMIAPLPDRALRAAPTPSTD